jgi:hypothetical protein
VSDESVCWWDCIDHISANCVSQWPLRLLPCARRCGQTISFVYMASNRRSSRSPSYCVQLALCFEQPRLYTKGTAQCLCRQPVIEPSWGPGHRSYFECLATLSSSHSSTLRIARPRRHQIRKIVKELQSSQNKNPPICIMSVRPLAKQFHSNSVWHLYCILQIHFDFGKFV